jgi:muconolactone D-isomerase
VEFLTHIRIDFPLEMSDEERAALLEREREHSAVLAEAGVQKRLWRDPGRRAVWALWDVEDATALHHAVSTLPLFRYMSLDVHALARHPGDPAVRAGRSA